MTPEDRQNLKPWLRWMPRWLLTTTVCLLLPAYLVAGALDGIGEGLTEWARDLHGTRR